MDANKDTILDTDQITVQCSSLYEQGPVQNFYQTHVTVCEEHF